MRDHHEVLTVWLHMRDERARIRARWLVDNNLDDA